MSGERRELSVHVGERSGEVSALLLRPPDARAVFVLAHGAGAGMRHAFMEAISERLAARRIATFRYQFPYTEREGRRPDPQPVLLATVRAAATAAREHCPDLPLLAGGKSMGGRMTSLAAAAGKLSELRGLVFLGFPLHPAGKPGSARADHLDEVSLPMLFLQGTRDRLAGLDLLRPVCSRLGARATLWIVEGGDHSFHVLKRSGRSDAELLDELADQTAAFAAGVAP